MSVLRYLQPRLEAARRSLWRMLQSASTVHTFALAFALFLAPVIYVAGELAEARQQAVDMARRERGGGDYLRVINEARALLNMHARAQDLGRRDIGNVSAAVRALRLAEGRYGAGLGTAELSERAVMAMRAIANGESAHATAMSAAVMALNDLAHKVGDKAHLARDPERASHSAAAIILERTPQLMQQSRALASLTQNAFADRHVSERERAQVLQELALMERAAGALSGLMNELIDSAPDTGLRTTLGPPAHAATANVAVYRAHVERALERGRLDTPDLVAAEAGAQFALAELAARVSSTLDHLLAERAEREASERTSTLLLAAALFLAVASFIVALLRLGLTQPIVALSASIRAMANGECAADIPALDRGDEIGDMARALAVLRDAAEARIAAEAVAAAQPPATTCDSGDVCAREGAPEAPLALVIDDDAGARDLAARALTQVGFAVQGVRTAAAGMALAREVKPALIILDINLPDRDGQSVISELAHDAETRETPIIVLSSEDGRQRSIELGAAAHLVKPATREMLCAAALRLARSRPKPQRTHAAPSDRLSA
jgi:CheY-like chemotaxis protein/HAMP domain-containing protein